MVQEAEVKHWKQLGIDYMTEESDDPTDPNAIIIHPLPWRSESEWVTIYLLDLISAIFAELNAFFSKLDRRYDAKVKKDGNTMAKKVRKTGSISDSPPPAGAPDWTLNPVQTGNKYTSVISHYECSEFL